MEVDHLVALATDIGTRILLIKPATHIAIGAERLFDQVPGIISIAEGIDAGIDQLQGGAHDVVVVCLGSVQHEDAESVALLAQVVSDVPLIVICDEDEHDELRHVLDDAAHRLLRLDAHSPASRADMVSMSVSNAAFQRSEIQADAKYRRLYDNAIAAIFSLDAAGNMLAANPAAVQMLGCQNERDLLQLNFANQICSSRRVGDELIRCLTDTGNVKNAELSLRRQTGGELTVLLCANSVLGHTGEVTSIEGTMIDVTEQKRAKDELTYLAKFDRLTGLSNRYLFKEALNRDIARANRGDGSVALLMIDLDRFKEVNDTLGHDVGDALLRAVATRLKQCTRQSDIVARLGGDEFAILIGNSDGDLDAIATVVRKIARTLNRPYQIGGHEVLTSPSIGIATTPDAGQHGDALLKAADIAMYRAKAEGRDRYVFYTDALHKEVVRRIALETSLRRAVDALDFTLAYQPKVSLRTEKIVEVEALLRWSCPDRGTVSPAEFIPVLERTGLINQVGNWVISKSVRDLQILQKQTRMPGLAVSVNLSVRQLMQQEKLIEHIAETLHQTKLDPICLEFEVTESSLMHDPERCIETLNALRDLGVRVSIDDFGTGFSSLQYLKNLPIHSIKIDRAFVRDIPDSTNDVAIIKATLALARSLELTVTAEGIETREQADFLRELDCEMGQGYYYARPTRIDELPKLLGMRPNQLTKVAKEASDRYPLTPEPEAPPQAIDSTISLPLPYFASRGVKH